jgi:hypothetical protein
MKNVAILFSGHIRSYDALKEVIGSYEKNLVNCNPNYNFKFFYAYLGVFRLES